MRIGQCFLGWEWGCPLLNQEGWWAAAQVRMSSAQAASVEQDTSVGHRRCSNKSQKNRRAHKKSWHFWPPPKKKQPKYFPHPPQNGRILVGVGVIQQKEPKIPGAHKLGTAISSPSIAGKKNYGHEASSQRVYLPSSRSVSVCCSAPFMSGTQKANKLAGCRPGVPGTPSGTNPDLWAVVPGISGWWM